MNYLPATTAKATVCASGTCVTLFGVAAQLVACVTVVGVAALFISLLASGDD
jgi:hypothetical protein